MSEGATFAEISGRRVVFCVAPQDVDAAWSVSSRFLGKVFAESKTHTADDVRDILLEKRANLWVQWCIDTGIVEAAFVTEFVKYPKGVWVRLWLGGAHSGSGVDYLLAEDALTKWAKQNGCRGFEIVGRHGWARKFPDAVVEGLCMRTTFS